MKRVGLLPALTVGFSLPQKAQSQVGIYGDFSAGKRTYLPNTNVLYGSTTGAFVNVVDLGPGHLSADIRGTFVDASGVCLDGFVVGPRAAFPLKFQKLTPHAEFMAGFARYTNGMNEVAHSGTDSEIQNNIGLDLP